jgi:hypothetical protein
VQGRLAERALYDGDRARAQRALDDAAGCAGDPATEITGLAALSELAHADPQGPAAARFRRALATARPRLSPADALMASALEGRAVMATDRAAGQRILTSVITNADGMQPGDLDGVKPRLLAYRRLISDAAERSDFARALELMAGESQTPLPIGCVLGLSEDLNRAVLVARGAAGDVVGRAGIDFRSAGPGATPVAAAELAVLKGCADVAVIGLSPFHGRSRLLPPEMAWRHHTHGPAAAEPGDERLVISDVAPPAGLPMLPPWQPGPDRGRFRHLRGPEANPGRVLAALPGADLIEFHVHGLVDASDASYLALAPDERGRSTLTAAQVRALRLPRRPLVVLAACDSAANSREFPSYSGRWSLPTAFISAGARAVLAATTAIPDAGAQEFMGDVVARIERGVPAAHALRDVRMAWLGRGQTWVNDVVLFE